MTMLPILKKCPLCGKKYSWNPDVGKFFCPHCSKSDEKPLDTIGKLFKKKEKQ